MSRSSVTEEIPREQFVSKWTILLFILGVLGVLFLLFAKDDLLEDVTHQKLPSMVTVEYLEELLAIKPSDQNLQMAMIYELIRLNEITKAKQAFKSLPVSTSKHLAERRRWLQYRLQFGEYIAIPPESTLKNASKALLANSIADLTATTLSADQIIDLSETALSLPDVELVRKSYLKLNEITRQLPANIYERAAKVALAIGDYNQSAAFFFKAQAVSPELALKREYFKQGVMSLQQGNMIQQALNSAEKQIVGLHLDRSTMLMMVRLALAANQPAIAQKYIQRALDLRKVETK